jgi:uncharacterized protein YcbX
VGTVPTAAPPPGRIATVSPSPVPEPIGRVSELRRYPVKSLGGELLQRVSVEERGVQGDRLWSVRDPDGKFGSGKSSRRFRKMDGLLALRATYDADVPVVTFPDGTVHRGDEAGLDPALSAHVGRRVSLGREADVPHFDDGPLHLVTTASLDALAATHGRCVPSGRFRANVVIDTGRGTGGLRGFVEQDWIGRRVTIGAVVLEVTAGMPRCVMVDMAQEGLADDPGLLRSITVANDAELGVVARVVRPGALDVGDPVTM